MHGRPTQSRHGSALDVVVVVAELVLVLVLLLVDVKLVLRHGSPEATQSPPS